MKNTLYLCLAAACVIAAVSAAETVNCSGLLLQKECADSSSTCTWTSNADKNTCTQSHECKDLSVTDCINDTNKTYCQQSGYTCSDNTTYCAWDATSGACLTGCTQTTTIATCAPVAAGFKCSSYNTSSGICSKNANWCVQDDKVTATCVSNNAGCPTTAQTSACTGPCTASSVTCVSANKCSAITEETTCTGTSGCAYTGGKCADASDCTAVNTQSDCTAKAQCQISTYMCAATTTEITNYCSAATLANCSSTAPYSTYCQLNNKSCVDSTTYCDNTAANNGCSTSKLCDVTYTCTNPQSGKCSGYTTTDTCVPNLCTSAYTTCVNETTDAQCNALNASSDKCQTATTPGCTFVAGGTCSTNESGTNSALVIAFSSALVGLALAL